MKKKAFDCVEMKRQGAAYVQAQLAGKTREQELEFWDQQSKLLEQRRQRAAKASAVPK